MLRTVYALVGLAFATVIVSPVLLALFSSEVFIVVANAVSFPIAVASSCKVFNPSGAEPTRLLTAVVIALDTTATAAVTNAVVAIWVVFVPPVLSQGKSLRRDPRKRRGWLVANCCQETVSLLT